MPSLIKTNMECKYACIIVTIFKRSSVNVPCFNDRRQLLCVEVKIYYLASGDTH
jgi:hypothetical protein